jgi:hypothetical protein
MNPLVTQIASNTISTAGNAATDVLNEQTRNSTNLTRTRLGKQPCTRMQGQPDDCPLPLFSIIGSESSPTSDGSNRGGSGGSRDDGISPTVMVMGIIGVGAVVAWLLTRKPKPKARKSRKSHR